MPTCIPHGTQLRIMIEWLWYHRQFGKIFKIMGCLKKKKTYSLRVLSADPYLLNWWETGGFWFHLEKIAQEKLIYLVNSGSNFEQIQQRPYNVYIICDVHILTTFASDKNVTCEDLFKKTEDKLHARFTELLYDEYPYQVRRFSSGDKPLDL